jgi:hypothetical protein
VSLLPVDHILALNNIVLIAVWTPLAATSDVARWMIGVHAVALALPLLLGFAGQIRTPLVAALRELYPLLWLAIFSRELGVRSVVRRHAAGWGARPVAGGWRFYTVALGALAGALLLARVGQRLRFGPQLERGSAPPAGATPEPGGDPAR